MIMFRSLLKTKSCLARGCGYGCTALMVSKREVTRSNAINANGCAGRALPSLDSLRTVDKTITATKQQIGSILLSGV